MIDMHTACTDVLTPSFPRRGVIRERFDREKDLAIESAMKKGDSWAKKVGTGQSGVLLDDIPLLLEALGLRAVCKSKVCVDKSVYESFRTLASAALSDPQKLQWEGE